MPKTRSKRPRPTRSHLAPTTAAQSRIPIWSPTDRPSPMNRVTRHEVENGSGKATIRGYRPTQRDRDVLDAIIGGLPGVQFDAKTTTIRIDVRRVARVCAAQKHPRWIWESLRQMQVAVVDIQPSGWTEPKSFQIVGEIVPDPDGYGGSVSLWNSFLHLWRWDTAVHSERLTADIAAVKSPVVRAVIRRMLTQASASYQEGIETALEAIDALAVTERERKRRFRAVRVAAKDGTLHRFGIRLDKFENLHFDSTLLAAEDAFVHIVPDRLAAYSLHRRAERHALKAEASEPLTTS